MKRGVLFGPPAAFGLLASGNWMQQGASVLIACALCLGLLWFVIRGTAAARDSGWHRNSGADRRACYDRREELQI